MRHMEGQLFQHVCEVLDQAGFRMRDGGRGLIVAATPQGVRVGWRPAYTPVTGLAPAAAEDAPDGYGRGIQAAMAVAFAAVLEGAGFSVSRQDTDLVVALPGPALDPAGGA